MWGFSSTEATALNCKALQSVCLVALGSWNNVGQVSRFFFHTFPSSSRWQVIRPAGETYDTSPRPDRPIHDGKKEAGSEEEAGDGPG